MKRLVILSILSFLCVAAPAQRTMNTQMFIGTAWTTPMGGEITVGQYQNFGYWETAVQGTLNGAATTDGSHFYYGHILAKGDYMFRLVKNRSHAINLYGGAGLTAGYELADVFSQIPSNKDVVPQIYNGSEANPSLAAGSFIYGAYPKLTLEAFPFPRVAFTVSAEADVMLGSQFLYLFPQVSAGIRFMLR